VDVVKELATLGADLSLHDKRERTPLAVAQTFAQKEVVLSRAEGGCEMWGKRGGGGGG
jgi:hypothetical protein